jgi:large subunit ribosomal protein LX
MNQFVVSGRYRTRDGHQAFTRTVEAPNADVARERIYSRLGSEHGLKRPEIELDSVETATEVAS